MTGRAGFAYCYARLSARFAALPGDGDWLRLAGARTLATFLEEARGGPLQPWIRGFSAGTDAHALERGLRALAWDLTCEVAAWAPPPWRAAIRWVAWIPYLPILAHLDPGAPAPPWVSRDPRLRALLDPTGTPDPAALVGAGLGDLFGGATGIGTAPADPARVAQGWCAAWRARWPGGERPPAPGPIGSSEARDLDALRGRLEAHLLAFRGADPALAWALRRALRERLRLLFHRRPRAPVGVFVYLALALLDLERLRAELLGRLLFPGREAARC